MLKLDPKPTICLSPSWRWGNEGRLVYLIQPGGLGREVVDLTKCREDMQTECPLATLPLRVLDNKLPPLPLGKKNLPEKKTIENRRETSKMSASA